MTREGTTDGAMQVDVNSDEQPQAGPSTGSGTIRLRRPTSTLNEQRTSETAMDVERDDAGPSSSGSMGSIMGGDEAIASSTPRDLPFWVPRNLPGPPDLRHRLHSGQDLLGRLGLLPAFDELVRPYIRIPEGDKGKGKEMEINGQIVEMGLQVHEQDEPHIEHTKGWREFASAIPGRFSTKKDDPPYLTDLLMKEPKQPQKLRPLDRSTLRAFWLEEGQLDVDALNELGIGPDSEKKKKHKEKKKAHFAPTGTTPAANGAAAGPSMSIGATPAPTAAGPSSATPVSSNDARSLKRPPPEGLQQQRPRPPPQQTQAVLPAAAQATAAPSAPNGATGSGGASKTLKVRKERDEGSAGTPPNGTSQQPPRPHKKRKTDPSQSNNVNPQPPRHPHQHPQHPQPMQQATPTF